MRGRMYTEPTPVVHFKDNRLRINVLTGYPTLCQYLRPKPHARNADEIVIKLKGPERAAPLGHLLRLTL